MRGSRLDLRLFRGGILVAWLGYCGRGSVRGVGRSGDGGGESGSSRERGRRVEEDGARMLSLRVWRMV